MMVNTSFARLFFFFILFTFVIAQEFDDQSFMDQLLKELAEGTSSQENSLSKRIQSKYNTDPTNGHTNNLMGVISYHQKDLQKAADFFQQACEADGFKEPGYLRNFVNTYNSLEFETVDVIYSMLMNHAHAYHLWVTFASIDTKNILEEISDITPRGVMYAYLGTQTAFVMYGLTLFPRSPELLFLRAVQYLRTGHFDCVEYFLHETTLTRHLLQDYTNKTQFDEQFATVSEDISAESKDNVNQKETFTERCLPRFAQHSVEIFQPVHFAMNRILWKPDWADIYNSSDPATLNQLVSSSMFKVTLDGKEVFLPSLHVGCSEYDLCVKTGFLIADGMDAVSTHFVTQAYDLSMLQSASFGLVYSSHTLEHLSHNNPPASTCATYPKSDRSVPGCYSEVDAALAEWRRVLVPGGTLLIAVPDIHYLLQYFSDPAMTFQQRAVLQKFIYGGQTSEYDFHKTGFYEEYLRELLLSHGFCNVTRVRDFGVFRDSSSLHFGPGRPISLNLHATACIH